MEIVAKKYSTMQALFGARKQGSKESLDAEGKPIPRILKFDCSMQSEVPTRTTGVATDRILMQDIPCETDIIVFADASSSTEAIASHDSSSQCSFPTREAGVDPGYWNTTLVRGIDAQTDSPSPHDPLFWLSGSRVEVERAVTDLLIRIESDHLGGASSKEALDPLKLYADNVLLRLELTELRRQLHRASRSLLSSNGSPVSRHSFSPFKQSIAGLVVGNTQSVTFIVDVTEGLPVTASLAPSSQVLGRLSKGNRVMTAGPPEEIGDLVRGPILPRGWVTLRDANKVYLRRP